MNARSTVLALSGVACCALLCVSLSALRSQGEAKDRLLAAQARKTHLLSELRRTESAIAAAAVPKPVPFLAPAADSAAAKPPAPRRAPGLTDLAKDNPQLWNDFIASQKAELQPRYVALFDRLNLPPEQRDKFKAIMAAEIARGADIGAAATAQGLTFKDPAIVKLREDSKKQKDSELLSLLGEQGFAGLNEFDRTVRVRGLVAGFAVQLSSSEPLTPGQAEQLARVLAGASPSYREGKEAEPKDVDWVVVDNAAPSFLSPAQFAAWKLGVAHNPYGGSRLDLQMTKIYEAAKMKKAPGG